MNCPNCGHEQPPEGGHCPQCGFELAAADEPAPGPLDLVTIHSTDDPSLFPVLKSLLEAEGIPCVVTDEVTQDLIGLGRLITGYNPILGRSHLQVAPENAEAARELIAHHIATREETPEPGPAS